MDIAKIEGEEIVIRIPIRELSGAACEGLDYVGYEGVDMNFDQLAKDIIDQMNSEDEDGTTPIHRLLDQAVIEASESGADAFAYLDK